METPAQFGLYDAEFKIDILSRALDEGDRGILDSSSRDEEFIDAVLRDHPIEERVKYRQHLQNEAWKEIELSRQAHRSAMLLSAYTLFEISVVKFAESYLSARKYDLRMRDIAGSGYEKFIVVADKIAKRRRHNEDLWKDASCIRGLRNLFAHNSGMIFTMEERRKHEKCLISLGGSDMIRNDESSLFIVELDLLFVKRVIAKLVMLIRSAYWTLFEEEQTC